MTITFDAVSSAQSSNATTLSVSHTAASTQSLAVIFVGWRGSTTLTPTVTYGGSSATKVVQASMSIANTALFVFSSPPASSQSVAVTFASTIEQAGLVVATYNGTTNYNPGTTNRSSGVSTFLKTTCGGGSNGAWIVGGTAVLQVDLLPTTANSLMTHRAGLDMGLCDFVFGDVANSSASELSWKISSFAHSYVGITMALTPSLSVGAAPAASFSVFAMG